LVLQQRNEAVFRGKNKYHAKGLRLSHFKKIDKNITTKIKGFEAPFKINADPELIKIGYDCGFGNGGSMGLGCVEIIINTNND
jgi:CRISPR-associated endoribonuclease Cas6